MSKERTYNNGQWTSSRFHSFVKSALRSASNRWGPKFSCLKAARVERGKYKCVGYKRKAHIVSASFKDGKKRVKNIYADHRLPVVDPVTGFTTWDNLIERLFVEQEGYDALCFDCHTAKSADERILRKHSKEHNSK